MSQMQNGPKRSNSRNMLCVAALLACASISGQTAIAGDVYWDIDGATAGAGGATPTGTWSTSATNWSADSTGSSATSAWVNGDSAIFSAGTNATGTYTLTMTGVTVDNITQQEGRVRLNNAGIITLADSAMTIHTQTRVSGDFDLRIDGVIAGAGGSVTKTGNGILMLGGANTFDGGFTLNGGQVTIEQIGAVGAFGSGTLTLNNGYLTRSWGTSGQESTISNALNVTGTVGIGIVQGNAGNVKFTGAWSAGNTSSVFAIDNAAINGLNIQASTIKIQGDASAYVGTFRHNTLSGGGQGNRLRLGPDNGGNVGFNAASAKFYLTGATSGGNGVDLADGTYGTVQMGELAGTGGRLLAGWANAGNTTFQVGALNTSSKFAGSLENNPNGSFGLSVLNKVGTGALELSKSTGNSYSGGTTVTAGSLLVTNTSGSATGTGAVTANSGTKLGGAGIIAPTGSNGVSISGTIAPGDTVSLTTGGSYTYGTGAMTFNTGSTTGTVTLNTGASLQMNLGAGGLAIGTPGTSDSVVVSNASSSDLAFNSNNIDFLGSGAGGFYKLFDTSFDASTWTGLTLGTATTGGNYITGITGSNTSSRASLIGFILGDGTAGTSAGDIYAELTGDSPKWTGKDGTNWVVGTTGANKNWKLITGGTATDYIVSDIVLFDDTASLANGAVTPGAVNITAANVAPSSTEFNNSVIDYTLSGGFGASGSLIKNGTSKLTISNANSFGLVSINSGAVNLQNSSGLGTASTATIASGAALELQSGISVSKALNLSGDGLTASPAGVLRNISGNNSISGAVSLGAHSTFQSDAGSLAISNTVSGTDTNLTLTGSGNGSITSVQTGNATLSKSGSGTWTLSTVSTYTGGTTVNGGTLELARNGGDGTGTIRGDLTINSGATVLGSQSNALGWQGGQKVNTVNINGGTYDGTGAGDHGWAVTWNLTGGLMKSNGGVSSTSSTSNFAFGGGTNVNTFASATTSEIAGRVNLREGNPSDNVTFTVDDGAAATDLLLSAGVSGNRNITKAGVGTMLVTGASTSTGSTTISAGTLQVGNGGTSGAIGSGSIFNDGNLIINRSDAYSNGSSVSGSGSLTQAGAGTTTLSGSLNYSGATTVNAGKLFVSTGLSSTSSVTVAGGASFGGVGSINALTTVAGGATIGTRGTIDTQNGGVGTLTFSSGLIGGGANPTDLLIFALDSGGPSLTTDLIDLGANPLDLGTGGGALIKLINLGGFAAGNSYTLMTFNNASAPNVALDPGSISFGLNTASLTVTASSVVLNITGAAAPANAYWVGDVGSTWSGLSGANTNWATSATGATDTAALPGSGTTNVFLTANTASNLSMTLGTGFDINSLTFTGTGTSASAGVTINADGNNLIVEAGGITVQSGAGAATINVPVALGASQTWANASANDLVVNGVVSGTGSLTINNTGTGATTLSGANTYNGGTTLSAGKLNINNATAIGTGSLTIDGGTIDNTSGSGITLTTNNPVTLNANVQFAGSNSLNLGNGNVSLTGNRTINVAANTLTLAGAIDDAGGGYGLSKTGAGTLTLGAVPNTYSGNTTLSAGTVVVPNNNTQPFGSGTVTLAGSSSTTPILRVQPGSGSIFSNAVFIRNNVDVPAGSMNLVDNSQTGFGNLWLGSDTATWTGSGTVKFRNNGASTVTGVLWIGSPLAGFNGTISYGSDTSTGNRIYSELGENAGGSYPDVSTFDAAGTAWELGSNGYSYTRAWHGVTLVKMGSIAASNTQTEISGNPVQLLTTYQVGALGTSTTYSGIISDGQGTGHLTSLEKVGSGTLTLNGSLTYTGATTVSDGTLKTVTALKNNAQVIATTGGKLDVPANGGVSGVTYISSVDTTSGKIDLHDNDMVVEYGAGPSSYTSILNQVKAGLALLGGTDADFDGIGDAGIGSTEVDLQTIAGTVLAVVDDGDPNIGGGITSISGYTIVNPAQSVLVKYTWFGDANLDGVVDGSDYALTDTGFTSGGALTGWVFGDMNFDGLVTGEDYALVDTGFIAQTGALPEPTTLGLLGLGAMGMLRRRRLNRMK